MRELETEAILIHSHSLAKRFWADNLLAEETAFQDNLHLTNNGHQMVRQEGGRMVPSTCCSLQIIVATCKGIKVWGRGEGRGKGEQE